MSARKPGNRHQPTAAVDSSADRRERRVSADMLVAYLNKVAPHSRCAFCGEGEYAIPSDPTGESASMVATPIPHMKSVGLWLYTAVCRNCANVVFFHAPMIATQIFKD